MNSEGYRDPTADIAVSRSEKEDRRVHNLVHSLRWMAKTHGFEIVGRVTLKDTKTGKEYR